MKFQPFLTVAENAHAPDVLRLLFCRSGTLPLALLRERCGLATKFHRLMDERDYA